MFQLNVWNVKIAEPSIVLKRASYIKILSVKNKPDYITLMERSIYVWHSPYKELQC